MAKKKQPEETAVENPPDLPIGMVPLLGCRCRCGHTWLPREPEKPRVCPKCKSPNWDRPKKWSWKSSDQDE